MALRYCITLVFRSLQQLLRQIVHVEEAVTMGEGHRCEVRGPQSFCLFLDHDRAVGFAVKHIPSGPARAHTHTHTHAHDGVIGRLTFIVMSLVLEAELSDFPLDRPAAKSKWAFCSSFKVSVRHQDISSVVKVRFKIRFYDFVAVPAIDRFAKLPPEQDS